MSGRGMIREEEGFAEVLAVVVLAMFLIIGAVWYYASQIKQEAETVKATLAPLEADHKIQSIQDTLGANLYSQTLRISQVVGDKGGDPEEIMPIVIKNLEEIMEGHKSSLKKEVSTIEFIYRPELSKKTKENVKTSFEHKGTSNRTAFVSKVIPTLETCQRKIEAEEVEAEETKGYAGGILASAKIEIAVKTATASASDRIYVDRFIPARFYTLYELAPTYQEKKKDSPISFVKSKLIVEQPTDKVKVKEMINDSLIDWAEKETVITYARNHVDVKLIPVEVKVTEVKKTEPSFKVTEKSVEYVEPKYIVKATVKYKLYLIDRNFKAVPTGKGESPYYQNLRYLVRQTGEEAEISESGIEGEIWKMKIEIETKAKGVKEPSLEEIEKIKQGLLSYVEYRASLEGQILTWDHAKQKSVEGYEAKQKAEEATRLAATGRSSWVVSDVTSEFGAPGGPKIYAYKVDGRTKSYVADLGNRATTISFTGGWSHKTISWSAPKSSWSTGMRAVSSAGYKRSSTTKSVSN